ncbi:Myosin-VIIa [Temnothorax longispinosus]|uniref:Myosin-VIIa n=1 Tax=Temnothorax longispinosus TaxID=300112 RepID=A0A4S2KJK0_9HYME|nr:Myosin-VIIa [Temnothorax longispinosus]
MTSTLLMHMLTNASSSNEAVHLQQRLRSLSTELVTLRNRLHVSQPANASGPTGGTTGPLSKSPEKGGGPTSPAPAVPPRTTLPPSGTIPHGIGHSAGHTLTASVIVHPHVNHAGANTLNHNSTAANNLISDLEPSKRHNGVPDDGIVSCVTALGCLRSPPISSIIADVKNAKSNQSQHRCLSKAAASSPGPATSTAFDDLIHLPGPLTEDAVLKCLQARFCAKQYHTNVGPILVCVNPYTDVGNPLTLTSTRSVPLAPQLNKVVQEAVRQQSETGYPQAIILSGTSGSGKTYASMLLLRQLFDVAGGGPETDAFKHLAAAFTVLRSLGSAKTATNSESSRIGHFIEVQVTDGALYRTKIHCYFLDQTRVIRPLPDEKNYHIFYQMLAGLSHDERVKLNLEGYNLKNLRYLQHGDTRQDEAEDAIRFQAWKACLAEMLNVLRFLFLTLIKPFGKRLSDFPRSFIFYCSPGVLGIPFLDVVRVLAAVLILGNVGFTDGSGVEVGVIGENELSSVATLLGVPPPALLRGLTSRTHNARGQLVKSVCDANMRTGLLSMLDVEGSIHGTAESYVAKVKVQHKQNPRLFEPRTVDCRSFGIQHFAGRVTYDTSDFLDTNKDVVPDDLVAVFYKHTCSFGFATHLFGSELKALYASDTVPRGVSFRISPTSHTDLLNGDEPISTLTQDFHTRLDNLLRTLVHARPHFVRCIRSNSTETPMHLDRGVTMRQIRSLQVLETVNLMAGGYPHRMRFKAFNARYRLIAPFKQLRRAEEQAVEDTKLILQNAQQLKSKFGASTSWAVGKRHIFLSEGIRQQLENLRAETRRKAATAIQSTWRGWHVRKRWPLRRTTLGVTSGIGQKKPQQPLTGTNTGTVQRNVTAGTGTGTGTRPRPQPIAGTPPPDPSEKCADQKMIQQTCTHFGLDLERPPPVPPSRSYTVTGNTKLGYPQTRIMKMPFPEEGEGEVVLLKGETVLVVGASPRRGHLVVEHNSTTLHVPYQFMELKPCNINV